MAGSDNIVAALLKMVQQAQGMPPDIGGLPEAARTPPTFPDTRPTAQQVPPPKNPNFLRGLLTDFVGTLSTSLKSGAFQKSVARGVATRRRGSSAGDAFAASFGALPEEQQQAEAFSEQQRVSQANRLAQEEQQRVNREREERFKKQEERLTKQAGEKNRVELLKLGQRINPETGEMETIPDDQLPPELRVRITRARNLEALDRAKTEESRARTELARARASAIPEQVHIAEQRLAVAQANSNRAERALGFQMEKFERQQELAIFRANKLPQGADAAKIVENANSGLRAIDKMEAMLQQDPNILMAASIPGSIGARKFAALRREVEDVITRLRTGAALNVNEEKFYHAQMPGLLDLTEPGAIDEKIAMYRELFASLRDRLSGANRKFTPSKPNGAPPSFKPD